MEYDSKPAPPVQNTNITYSDKVKQNGKKPSSKKEPIIDSKCVSGKSSGNIKAVVKREWVFVSRLTPEVTG